MHRCVPKISVLMPVFNCVDYLQMSVDSILTQTFPDFELIIIDDGSTDGSRDVLSQIKDPRVRMVFQKHLGITKALNYGMELCQGHYIARQDADDVSYPRRFETQLNFLNENLDFGLSACFTEVIDEQGNTLEIKKPPMLPNELHQRLILCNCIVHGSVMIRREAVSVVGMYREEFKYAQDYDLWLRMIEVFPLSGVPVVLYKYRKNAQSISNRYTDVQQTFIKLARELALERRLNGKDVKR